jgi:putative endonuclease
MNTATALCLGLRAGTKSISLSIFEVHSTALTAIQREKNMKHWSRSWKTRLIFQSNPTWRDLYDEIAV